MENNETVVIYSETSGYVCVSEESWRRIEGFQSGKFFCGKDLESLGGMYQFNACLPGVKTKEGARVMVRCVTFNENQEARYPHLHRFCRTEFIRGI